MAYEDVDWCLRAWQAGLRVLYFPSAQLVHHESVTRGTELGERERDSQRLFWERWSSFFDARETWLAQSPGASGQSDSAPGPAEGKRPASGGAGASRPLRIVYVTEDTGVGGGHRDIFEHLNRLAARGHDVALYTLGDGARVVRAARAGAQLRGLRRARRRARAARRDQGRDVVDDRRRRCGGRASRAGCRSTSCRTSRPPTTPTTSARATRCSTPTVPSSAT